MCFDGSDVKTHSHRTCVPAHRLRVGCDSPSLTAVTRLAVVLCQLVTAALRCMRRTQLGKNDHVCEVGRQAFRFYQWNSFVKFTLR